MMAALAAAGTAPRVPGIYRITNTANGKCYIGSASKLRDRLGWHLWAFRAGRHQRRLQNSWNKHGAEAFRFEILELCDAPMLEERENYFIGLYRPEYNLAPVAGSCLGLKHSDESRCARRKAMAGKRPSDATRAALLIAITGKPLSAETRAKISAVTRGKPHSAEHNARMRVALIGRKRSAEHCANLSAAKKGKPGPKHTPVTIAKMREAQRRRFLEHKVTDETREKNRQAAIRRYPQRRRSVQGRFQ